MSNRTISTLFALVYVTPDGEWIIPIDKDKDHIEPAIAQSLEELEQFRRPAEIYAGAMNGRVKTVRFERVADKHPMTRGMEALSQEPRTE